VYEGQHYTYWQLTGYRDQEYTQDVFREAVELDNTADDPCPDDDDGGGDDGDGGDDDSWEGFLGDFMGGAFAHCLGYPTEPGGPLSGVSIFEFSSQANAQAFAAQVQTSTNLVFTGNGSDPLLITPLELEGIPGQQMPGHGLSCADVWAIWQAMAWAGATPQPGPIVNVPGTATAVPDPADPNSTPPSRAVYLVFVIGDVPQSP